jgi:hypothetical protein
MHDKIDNSRNKYYYKHVLKVHDENLRRLYVLDHAINNGERRRLTELKDDIHWLRNKAVNAIFSRQTSAEAIVAEKWKHLKSYRQIRFSVSKLIVRRLRKLMAKGAKDNELEIMLRDASQTKLTDAENERLLKEMTADPNQQSAISHKEAEKQ